MQYHGYVMDGHIIAGLRLISFRGGEGAESVLLLAMIEQGILLSFFGHMRLLDNT